MRIFKLVIISATIALPFYSCKKDPTACMEISSTTVNTGQDITFKTCSENALSYDWYFVGPVGAPENSMGNSEMEFTHQFTVPGTYEIYHVAFEKFSSLGNADTTSQIITVN